MLELAKNDVSKNTIISKVFLKKILEFLLRYWILTFRATFLMPLLNYCSVEKRSGKKDLIWPIGPGSFKMVLSLMVETIAI